MQHYFKVTAFVLVVVLLIQCSSSKNANVSDPHSQGMLGLKQTKQRCSYKGNVDVKLYKTLYKKDTSFSTVSVEFQNNDNYAFICERSEKGNLSSCQMIDCNSKTKYLLTVTNDSIQVYKTSD